MFVRTRHAGTGLVLDGLLWGASVGALLTLPWAFLLGLGPLIGAGLGGGVGLVAGLAYALWSRLGVGSSPAALVVATVGPTLVVVYLVTSVTVGFGVELTAAPALDPGALLVCGLAAVPLTVDVARRAGGHHRRRDAPDVTGMTGATGFGASA